MKRQNYKEADKVSLPFYEYSEKILSYGGFSVVKENENKYDATLQIESLGTRGGEYYSDRKFHWTKATLEGKILLSTKEKSYKWDFSYTEEPYFSISSGTYLTPNDAPFEMAFNKGFLPALFKVLSEIKGIYPVISALKDKDGYVREVAAKALGEIKDKRAVEPLISALKDKDGSVREAAKEALEKINPKWMETEEAKRAVLELISALNDEYWYVREAAAKALGKIKDKRAVEPLISALKDKAGRVREAAAKALGEIKDPRAVEPLISALKDEDKDVRRAAKEALEKITGMDFGTDYEKWNNWWQENKEKFGR